MALDPATAALISGGIGALGSIFGGNAAADGSRAAADVQRYMYDTTREDYAPYRSVGVSALNQLAALYGLGGQNSAEMQRLEQILAAMPERVQTGFDNVLVGMDGSRADVYEQRPIYQDNTDARARLQAQIDALRNAPTTDPAARFDAFRDSPDYQFAFDEGLRSVRNGMGGDLGGNELAALTRYGQGMASQQLNNYTNRLASIAGIGQTATQSLGGLGAGFAANQGAALQNAGNARASSYLGIGNSAGNALNQYMLGQGYNDTGGRLQMGNFQFNPSY